MLNHGCFATPRLEGGTKKGEKGCFFLMEGGGGTGWWVVTTTKPQDAENFLKNCHK